MYIYVLPSLYRFYILVIPYMACMVLGIQMNHSQGVAANKT